MIKKIYRAINKYNMISYGDSILVALSGGADSVCLLMALMEIKEQLSLSLSAIHINHSLRGSESDADEAFCVELCRKLSIPVIVERHNVAERAKNDKLSVEEAARNVRYEVFAKYSNGIKLATAHTASDNAETILLNLTRGTGLKGLVGIPPVRDNIIRPLIYLSRQEVEQYLDEQNQDYVTDATNLDDVYSRNKIRHNIIPVLTEINQSVISTISSNVNALELENEFIEQQSDAAYRECFRQPLSLVGLHKYHKAVRHRCIVRLLSAANQYYSQDRIFEIDNICMSKGKINLSNDVYIISKLGTLSIENISPEAKDTSGFQRELRIGKNPIFRGRTCIAELVDKSFYEKNEIINTKFAIYLLDYDKIQGKAILRSRKYGDKIRLSNRSFTSSVKKLLNAGFSSEERAELCFLADDDGVVLVERIGIAERVKPDFSTERVLKLEFKNRQE